MPASAQPPADSPTAESVSGLMLKSVCSATMSLSMGHSGVTEQRKGNLEESEMVFNMMAASNDGMLDSQTEVDLLNSAIYKRANVTECVPVSSSDHVAEIVGKQGAKIKALRQRTNTYIRTPCRGDEPVFIITGRREDVMVAKREILNAAEQVSLLRARRSLQAAANLSVADAIATSNLLAGLNLAPALLNVNGTLGSLNPSALVNVNLPNSTGLNVFALNPASNPSSSCLNAVASATLQNALLSNSLQQKLPCSSSSLSAQPHTMNHQANSIITRSNLPTLSQLPTQVENGSCLATLSNSRVLSRLASATGVAQGNSAALLAAVNSGLLNGLPSYMPPGFNLATAKHIAHLRVPERIVGLIVGPRGATIKQIQQKTSTYILTPSKGDRDAVFEIIGTAEGCSTAKQDIENYVLSRTGLTVEQLLIQQSQMRALEAYCQSSGLNLNHLVSNALMSSSTATVDHNFASSATLMPRCDSSLPSDAKGNTLSLRDCLSRSTFGEQAEAAKVEPEVANAMHSLLASIAACSASAEHAGRPADSATASNANDLLSTLENAWDASLSTRQSDPFGRTGPHGDVQLSAAMERMSSSLFDNVYANLNNLVSGPDESTAADNRRQEPSYPSTRFCDAATPPRTDLNENVDAAAERRPSFNLRSLLAGLGLDTALCDGRSSGLVSPCTSTTSGLGASLNGFASSGHLPRAAATAGLSPTSSTGSSPAVDMFTSCDAPPTGNLLHALTAMRI